MLLDEDGNIRLGTREASDVMFIKGTTGELYINANKVHFIVNGIEWNDLVFNKAAVNPTQPALTIKPEVILNKELSLYDVK